VAVQDSSVPNLRVVDVGPPRSQRGSSFVTSAHCLFEDEVLFLLFFLRELWADGGRVVNSSAFASL